MENVFEDYITACSYFYKNMEKETSLNTTIIINNVSFSVCLYKLKDNVTLNNKQDVNNIFTSCTKNDDNTQIILCKNLIINNNVTLTPPYRCKGLIIFTYGKIINYGTISMTSRGCIGAGQNIYLFKKEFVPAVGGSGGAGQSLYHDGNAAHGINGSAGTKRATGGGGSGGLRNWGHSATTGRGGNGTSYSGGPGSGGANSDGGGGWNVASGNGSDTGGAGSNGVTGARNGSGYSIITTGGQGNPNGGWSSYRITPTAFTCSVYGTGGLLIIFSNTFINYNNIQSNGGDTIIPNQYPSNKTSGGASGGGSVNIFYNKIKQKGNVFANGGKQTAGYTYSGGAGGNGSVTLTQVPIDYFVDIDLNSIRINSDIYNDSKPYATLDYETFLKVLGE